MPFQEFLHGPGSQLWQSWRAPIVALLAGLAARFLGRAAGKGELAAQSAAIGALAGWCVLAYPNWRFASLTLDTSQSKLPVLGLAALAAGWLGALSPRAGSGLVVALAAGGAWYLLGAPLRYAENVAILPQIAMLAALGGITMLWLRAAHAWTIALAALAGWIAIGLAEGKLAAGPFWPLAAACACAGAASLLGREGEGHDDLAAAGAIGLVAMAADLALGRLRGNGFTPFDMACCAPLAVGFAAPRLGGGDVVLGSFLAALGAVAVVWGVKVFG